MSLDARKLYRGDEEQVLKGKKIEQSSIEGEQRWGNNETGMIKWMQKWNIEEREGDGNLILDTFKMLPNLPL